jgi:demethylmenaquinone methyltransferase/2-methoxy-6-polyprenyl-1,4-benzoquinol methylase
MLAAGLRLGGKIFFVDGRRERGGTAANHQLPAEGEQLMIRKLNDGRAFEIVKNFYDPGPLAGRFSQHGLSVTMQETATYFLFGYGEKEKSVFQTLAHMGKAYYDRMASSY